MTTCDEGVTRAGEFQPCERPAVALRLDPEHGSYPVCVGHTRHPMAAVLSPGESRALLALVDGLLIDLARAHGTSVAVERVRHGLTT